MKTTRIGVIGCGYWGPNYVRILNEMNESKVACCSDLEEKNLARIRKLYRSIRTMRDYRDIARSPDVDAVIVTTPLESHYEITKICLRNEKHVLVEKPFTATLAQGRELVRIADKKRLCLMVGHVYEYHPGIVKLKELIKKRKLGILYYVHAERVGLGPIRRHANALWDLATHDIAISLFILGEYPDSVSCVGGSYIQERVDDVVFLSLTFPSKVIYNIHTTWVAPEKIRKVTVVGSEGMAVFDDVNKSEMLKIYEREIDKGLIDSTPEYSDHLAIVSIGDIHIPRVALSEPLNNQVRHFIECVTSGRKPLTDGRSGLRVLRILEAAERSIRAGRKVDCR